MREYFVYRISPNHWSGTVDHLVEAELLQMLDVFSAALSSQASPQQHE